MTAVAPLHGSLHLSGSGTASKSGLSVDTTSGMSLGGHMHVDVSSSSATPSVALHPPASRASDAALRRSFALTSQGAVSADDQPAPYRGSVYQAGAYDASRYVGGTTPKSANILGSNVLSGSAITHHARTITPKAAARPSTQELSRGSVAAASMTSTTAAAGLSGTPRAGRRASAGLPQQGNAAGMIASYVLDPNHSSNHSHAHVLSRRAGGHADPSALTDASSSAQRAPARLSRFTLDLPSSGSASTGAPVAAAAAVTSTITAHASSSSLTASTRGRAAAPLLPITHGVARLGRRAQGASTVATSSNAAGSMHTLGDDQNGGSAITGSTPTFTTAASGRSSRLDLSVTGNAPSRSGSVLGNDRERDSAHATTSVVARDVRSHSRTKAPAWAHVPQSTSSTSVTSSTRRSPSPVVARPIAFGVGTPPSGKATHHHHQQQQQGHGARVNGSMTVAASPSSSSLAPYAQSYLHLRGTLPSGLAASPTPIATTATAATVSSPPLYQYPLVKSSSVESHTSNASSNQLYISPAVSDHHLPSHPSVSSALSSTLITPHTPSSGALGRSVSRKGWEVTSSPDAAAPSFATRSATPKASAVGVNGLHAGPQDIAHQVSQSSQHSFGHSIDSHTLAGGRSGTVMHEDAMSMHSFLSGPSAHSAAAHTAREGIAHHLSTAGGAAVDDSYATAAAGGAATSMTMADLARMTAAVPSSDGASGHIDDVVHTVNGAPLLKLSALDQRSGSSQQTAGPLSRSGRGLNSTGVPTGGGARKPVPAQSHSALRAEVEDRISQERRDKMELKQWFFEMVREQEKLLSNAAAAGAGAGADGDNDSGTVLGRFIGLDKAGPSSTAAAPGSTWTAPASASSTAAEVSPSSLSGARALRQQERLVADRESKVQRLLHQQRLQQERVQADLAQRHVAVATTNSKTGPGTAAAGKSVSPGVRVHQRTPSPAAAGTATVTQAGASSAGSTAQYGAGAHANVSAAVPTHKPLSNRERQMVERLSKGGKGPRSPVRNESRASQSSGHVASTLASPSRTSVYEPHDHVVNGSAGTDTGTIVAVADGAGSDHHQRTTSAVASGSKDITSAAVMSGRVTPGSSSAPIAPATNFTSTSGAAPTPKAAMQASQHSRTGSTLSGTGPRVVPAVMTVAGGANASTAAANGADIAASSSFSNLILSRPAMVVELGSSSSLNPVASSMEPPWRQQSKQEDDQTHEKEDDDLDDDDQGDEDDDGENDEEQSQDSDQADDGTDDGDQTDGSATQEDRPKVSNDDDHGADVSDSAAVDDVEANDDGDDDDDGDNDDDEEEDDRQEDDAVSVDEEADTAAERHVDGDTTGVISTAPNMTAAIADEDIGRYSRAAYMNGAVEFAPAESTAAASSTASGSARGLPEYSPAAYISTVFEPSALSQLLQQQTSVVVSSASHAVSSTSAAGVYSALSLQRLLQDSSNGRSRPGTAGGASLQSVPATTVPAPAAQALSPAQRRSLKVVASLQDRIRRMSGSDSPQHQQQGNAGLPDRPFSFDITTDDGTPAAVPSKDEGAHAGAAVTNPIAAEANTSVASSTAGSADLPSDSALVAAIERFTSPDRSIAKGSLPIRRAGSDGAGTVGGATITCARCGRKVRPENSPVHERTCQLSMGRHAGRASAGPTAASHSVAAVSDQGVLSATGRPTTAHVLAQRPPDRPSSASAEPTGSVLFQMPTGINQPSAVNLNLGSSLSSSSLTPLQQASAFVGFAADGGSAAPTPKSSATPSFATSSTVLNRAASDAPAVRTVSFATSTMHAAQPAAAMGRRAPHAATVTQQPHAAYHDDMSHHDDDATPPTLGLHRPLLQPRSYSMPVESSTGSLLRPNTAVVAAAGAGSTASLAAGFTADSSTNGTSSLFYSGRAGTDISVHGLSSKLLQADRALAHQLATAAVSSNSTTTQPDITLYGSKHQPQSVYAAQAEQAPRIIEPVVATASGVTAAAKASQHPESPKPELMRSIRKIVSGRRATLGSLQPAGAAHANQSSVHADAASRADQSVMSRGTQPYHRQQHGTASESGGPHSPSVQSPASPYGDGESHQEQWARAESAGYARKGSAGSSDQGMTYAHDDDGENADQERNDRFDEAGIRTKSAVELEAEAVAMDPSSFVPCSECHRTFRPDRLAVHERVCKTVFVRKRAPLNVVAARLKGTEGGAFFDPSAGSQCPHCQRQLPDHQQQLVHQRACPKNQQHRGHAGVASNQSYPMSAPRDDVARDGYDDLEFESPRTRPNRRLAPGPSARVSSSGASSLNKTAPLHLHSGSGGGSYHASFADDSEPYSPPAEAEPVVHRSRYSFGQGRTASPDSFDWSASQSQTRARHSSAHLPPSNNGHGSHYDTHFAPGSLGVDDVAYGVDDSSYSQVPAQSRYSANGRVRSPHVPSGSSSPPSGSSTGARASRSANASLAGLSLAERASVLAATKRVMCPHCGKGFSHQASERHIEVCQNVRSKPKALTRNNTQLAYMRVAPGSASGAHANSSFNATHAAYLDSH